jgi:CheY-like chemotaxis protein
MNLGTNAWHAMRDKTGCLSVSLENFEVDAHAAAAQTGMHVGSYVRLSVSDNGCGMPKATMARIFEPFFTTKGPNEGTGLGLSVVHGIMSSHGGVITVYSQPGEGTTFHLYFPVYVGEAAKANSANGTIPQGQGERILYLDDEEVLAQLGKHTLEMIGFRVDACTSAVEALGLIRAEPQRFDLVISDQTMPGMTGVELIGHLRKIRPELPVILSSGNVGYLSAERLKELGITELLVKPHTMAILAQTVNRALNENRKNCSRAG